MIFARCASVHAGAHRAGINPQLNTKYMIALEIIKSESFQTPVVIRDNHNRECSFNITQRGVVVHAATQRSTAFISNDADNAEGYASAIYWCKYSPASRDAWIESTVAWLDLATCNEAAFHAVNPDVTVRKIAGSGALSQCATLTATAPSGALVTSVSAFTWQGLNDRLHPVTLSECQRAQSDAAIRFQRLQGRKVEA